MPGTNPHNDQLLGQIGPLQITEGDWGRQRQVSLAQPPRAALLVLPVDALLTARLVAEDEQSDDDDPTLQDLFARADDALQMSPMNGYLFTQQCMAGGYDPASDSYYLNHWVVAQLQKAVHAAHPDRVPKSRHRRRSPDSN